MATGSEQYRKHPVWETLQLKRDALNAARFDEPASERRRQDVVEWLDEAAKTKLAAQPALYLGVLQPLNEALNALPVTSGEFNNYANGYYGNNISALEGALQNLPLPPPKALGKRFIALLDAEITARTDRLDALEDRVKETESALETRLKQLRGVEMKLQDVQAQIETERTQIREVTESAATTIETEWTSSLNDWRAKSDESSATHNEAALEHVASLAATARAGEALAEHAAGTLSASDWSKRASRERFAAIWIRVGAVAVFILAVAIAWFVVGEAIRNNFDLTLGDGVLRASIAVVAGAFGALLLREAGRHFREADTAEDVALSLQALAPFYAGQSDATKLAARVQIGDAVLVKNVLSRFAHRDAAKHANETDGGDLPTLIQEATRALRKTPEAMKEQ